jgi:hypothetical protein
VVGSTEDKDLSSEVSFDPDASSIGPEQSVAVLSKSRTCRYLASLLYAVR